MIKTYTKKPVTIEALVFEYSVEGIKKLKEFCGDALGDVTKQRHLGSLGEAHIHTLKDGKWCTVKHIATEGDYIIKGVHGEFYACKPNIFLLTYSENVKDAT